MSVSKKDCRLHFCIYYWIKCSHNHNLYRIPYVSRYVESISYAMMILSLDTKKQILASTNCWSTLDKDNIAISLSNFLLFTSSLKPKLYPRTFPNAMKVLPAKVRSPAVLAYFDAIQIFWIVQGNYTYSIRQLMKVFHAAWVTLVLKNACWH